MDYEYFTEEYVEKKDHAASVQLKRLLSRLPLYCEDLADSLTTYSPVTLLHRMRDLDDFLNMSKIKQIIKAVYTECRLPFYAQK